MKAQDGNRVTLSKKPKNTLHRYPTVLQKLDKTYEQKNTRIMRNT